MNAADFDKQFDRLTGHFHLPTDATRETLAMDWYQALQGFSLDVLERAVTHLIRTEQERFWPALGKLLAICRGKASGSAPGGKCATCHGSTWLDSGPFKSNGMVYDNVVMRCPDCSTPPPHYTAPSHRETLTSLEYRAWSEHRADYMPDECKAKPWHPEAKAQHVTSMRAAFDRLRLKLFGEDVA